MHSFLIAKINEHVLNLVLIVPCDQQPCGMVIWASHLPPAESIKYIMYWFRTRFQRASRQLYVNMLTMHCVSGIYGVQNICNQIVLWFSRHLHMQGGQFKCLWSRLH